MRLDDYKLSCMIISIKQVLFHLKTYQHKNKRYFESLNNYFLIDSKSNEEAEQILNEKLYQHQEDLRVLKI